MNGKTWMHDLYVQYGEKWSSKMLKDIVLPGVHHAVSGDWKSDKVHDKFTQKVKKCLRKKYFNWSVTQSLSLQELLNTGVRVLDLRPLIDEITTFKHGVVWTSSPTANEVFRTIRKFLDTNQSEIIIIYLKVFGIARPDMNSTDTSAFIKCIDEHLADIAIPSSKNLPSLHIKELLESNTRLGIVWDQKIFHPKIHSFDKSIDSRYDSDREQSKWSQVRQCIKEESIERPPDYNKLSIQAAHFQIHGKLIAQQELKNAFTTIGCGKTGIIPLTQKRNINELTSTYIVNNYSRSFNIISFDNYTEDILSSIVQCNSLRLE